MDTHVGAHNHVLFPKLIFGKASNHAYDSEFTYKRSLKPYKNPIQILTLDTYVGAQNHIVFPELIFDKASNHAYYSDFTYKRSLKPYKNPIQILKFFLLALPRIRVLSPNNK